jgi:hypothetical protein
MEGKTKKKAGGGQSPMARETHLNPISSYSTIVGIHLLYLHFLSSSSNDAEPEPDPEPDPDVF